MKSIYLVLLCAIFGCAPPQNYSQYSAYSKFKNSCFEIKKDSYLYSLNYCMDDSAECFSIQSFIDTPENTDLPKSEIDFKKNKDKFLKNIKHLAGIGGLEPIYLGGFAKKGSKFKIRNIYNGYQGSLGRFWFVNIEFQDSLLKGKSVFVPIPYDNLSPSWTKPSSLESGPIWDEKFVGNCAKS